MRFLSASLILMSAIGLTGCIVEPPPRRPPPPPPLDYDRRPPPPPVDYDHRPPPPPDYPGPPPRGY
jgi:hypothetical protein